MFSQSLNTAELSAPLPRWAVFAALALIAVITAIFVLALPAPATPAERVTVAAAMSCHV